MIWMHKIESGLWKTNISRILNWRKKCTVLINSDTKFLSTHSPPPPTFHFQFTLYFIMCFPLLYLINKSIYTSPTAINHIEQKKQKIRDNVSKLCVPISSNQIKTKKKFTTKLKQNRLLCLKLRHHLRCFQRSVDWSQENSTQTTFQLSFAININRILSIKTVRNLL